MTPGRRSGTLPGHHRLQHQHLEHQRDVVRLSSGIALALLLVDQLSATGETAPSPRCCRVAAEDRPAFPASPADLHGQRSRVHAICPVPDARMLSRPNRGIIRDALNRKPDPVAVLGHPASPTLPAVLPD